MSDLRQWYKANETFDFDLKDDSKIRKYKATFTFTKGHRPEKEALDDVIHITKGAFVAIQSSTSEEGKEEVKAALIDLIKAL